MEEERSASEYHYHYGLKPRKYKPQKEKRRLSKPLAMISRAILAILFIVGVCFLEGMIIVGALIVGSITLVTGGGALISLVAGGYLLAVGVSQLMAGISTSLGVLGISFISLACSSMFVIITICWIKKGVPSAIILYDKINDKVMNIKRC